MKQRDASHVKPSWRLLSTITLPIIERLEQMQRQGVEQKTVTEKQAEKKYSWRDLVISAADMQHMTDEELDAHDRRSRRIIKIMEKTA
jgi:hypothetical protein